MMKVDFHIHTRCSPDSMNRPEDIVRVSKKLGIVPVISDHNSVEAHKEFKKFGAEFIPAEEVTTDMGDLIGIYVQDKIPKKTPFLETLDRIREQEGIAYLPHMFDSMRSIKKKELGKKVEIIEVFNGRCISEKYNDMALEFAERNNKLKGAGSDAHLISEVGNAYVEMDDFDIENPKELLKSLKNGKVFGKRSPLQNKIATRLIKLRKFFG